MEGRYISIDEPESVVHTLWFDDQAPLIDEHDAKWLVRVWNEARVDADRSERGVQRGRIRRLGTHRISQRHRGVFQICFNIWKTPSIRRAMTTG